MINLLKFHLQRAQNRMKVQADGRRSDRHFDIGSWVWLKLQPYRQTSLKGHPNEKLAPKYYGPFQVEQCVGSVAYKLNLPNSVKIHTVFHVSQLKAFKGTLPTKVHIPEWFQGQDVDDQMLPTQILERRVIKHQNAPLVQYLVQWVGFPTEAATWENAIHFEQNYPHFVG